MADVVENCREVPCDKFQYVVEVRLHGIHIDSYLSNLSTEGLSVNFRNFTNLCCINIYDCRVSEATLVRMLEFVSELPCMKTGDMDPKARFMNKAQLTIQKCGVTNGLLRELRTCRFNGVTKLDLSHNNISDRCMKYASQIFPNLVEFYVCGNSMFTGTSLENMTCKWFASLAVLGIDRTGISDANVQFLIRGLSTREDNTPLEIWMRSMLHPMCANWSELIRTYLNTKRGKGTLIKHDLQGAATHDRIFVRVTLKDNHTPLTEPAVYSDCPSYTTFGMLAQCVASEVAACIYPVEETKRLSTDDRDRNNLYQRVFRHIVQSTIGSTTQLAVDKVDAKYVDKYTQKEIVLDARQDMVLGRPQPGINMHVDVSLTETQVPSAKVSRRHR